MGRNLKLVLSVLQGGECDPLHAQLYLSRGGGHDDGGGGRGSWPASQQDNLGTNLATQGEEKLLPAYVLHQQQQHVLVTVVQAQLRLSSLAE